MTRFPHALAARIHVALRISHHLGFGADFKPAKDDA